MMAVRVKSSARSLFCATGNRDGEGRQPRSRCSAAGGGAGGGGFRRSR